MRIIRLYFFLGLLVFSFTLEAADQQVRVIVDRAAVHAEAHEDSYLIDHVTRGSILNLFQPGRIRDDWYYVKFTSQRYGAPVTGFILANQVAPLQEGSVPVEKTRPIEEEPPKTEPPAPAVKSVSPLPDIRLGDTPPPPARSIPPSESSTELLQRHWGPERSPPPPPQIGLGFSPVPAARSLRAARTASPVGYRFKTMDPAPPPAEQPPPVPSPPPGIGGRKLAPGILMRQTGTSLEFTLDSGPFDSYRHFTMTDPDRIVVDLQGSGRMPPSRHIASPHPDLSAIRTGLFKTDVTRTVFDFTGRLPAFTIKRDGDRLIIVLSKPAPPGEASAAAPPRIDLEQTSIDSARRPVPIPSGRVDAQAFKRMRRPAPPIQRVRTVETELPNRPGPIVPFPQDIPSLNPWTPASPAPKPKPPPTRSVAQTAAPVFKKTARMRGRVLLGLGYGASPGGMGAFFQFNLRSGLAFHAGLGAYPSSLIYQDSDWVKNRLLASLGVKVYLPFHSRRFHPYLDIQYGGLRVEAVRVITRIWDYAYEYSNEQKTLYGPSLLGGFELRFGRVGLNAAGGISYALTEWEWQEKRLQAALDIGLVIHF